MKNIHLELVHKALQKFRKTILMPLDYQLITPPAGHGPDAIIALTLQDKELRFAAEIKHILTRATIGITVQQMMKYADKGIIIAQYINPILADELKEMNIPFIDTAGNVYINEPPLFIFIKGNKVEIQNQLVFPARAFHPAGIRVIYALLCKPGIHNAPLRTIAAAAGVALGTVDLVLKNLKDLGYLIDVGTQGRRLARTDNLLTRWVTAYTEQLRPKLLLGRFRTNYYDWWKNIEINKYNAYWGGEVAANIMTQYLKPQTITIYARVLNPNLLIRNKLIRDPHGDVEFIRQFWNFEPNLPYTNLVHPLLIYADLIATADTRNLETARIIYDQQLVGLIKEN